MLPGQAFAAGLKTINSAFLFSPLFHAIIFCGLSNRFINPFANSL
jgi:hypothetical protein